MSKQVICLHKFYRCIIVVLCLLGGAFMLMTITPIALRWWYNITYVPINETDEQQFEKRLMEGSMILLEDKTLEDNIIYWDNPMKFIKNSILSFRTISVYEYGEYGLMLFYLNKYADKRSNVKLFENIKNIVDNEMLEGDTIFDVVRTDQLTYGLILTELYKKTKSVKYKNAADKLMRFAKKRVTEKGLLTYKDNGLQQIDVLGFAGQFLKEYALTFKDTIAMQIREQLIEEYWRYGINHQNGIPAKAYGLHNKVPTKHVDWGRSFTWLIMGDYIIPDDAGACIMDSTLLAMGPLMPQYLGDPSSKPDMSVTIPVMYYLSKRKLKRITKKEFIKAVTPFIREDGVVCFNSPSYAMPYEEPNAHHYAHLTQALALYLFTLLED